MAERKSRPKAELGPLPGGHHGLSPQQVAESQRERLLAAVAAVVAERGYPAATITEIVKTASVANRVFYDNFATKEEAFLAVFDAVHAHLEELIAAAAAPHSEWPQRVIAALRACLEFFTAEPDLARVALLAPFSATPTIVTRLREAVADATPYLRAGRTASLEGASLPASTEDSLLGGAISIASRSILTESQTLDILLPDLIDFLLTPYLGADDAKKLAAEAASHPSA